MILDFTTKQCISSYNYRYGGLESHIKNSYLNTLLQMLFFIWPLRELAKTHIRHSCTREPCLSCELGFLFRMLECCEGVNCQASNFLRAFGLIPQGFYIVILARALGLLEVDGSSFGALIQTSCRFVLEQIHQEMNDPLFSRLVGISVNSKSRCDNGHEFLRETKPFVIDLLYSTKKKLKNDFVDLLKSSINKSTVTKAWCSLCDSYQNTTQTKELASPPNFMCINANVNNETDIDHWITESPESWLPLSIAIIMDGDLQIIDMDHKPDLSKYKEESVSVYDLRATIAEIKTEKQGHLVGHINVSESPVEPNWHLFNDFTVQKVDEENIFQKVVGALTSVENTMYCSVRKKEL